MNWRIRALKKSPWVFHVNTGACNNCDIEIVDLLTPRFDVERFGTGGVTAQAAPRLREVYRQTPKPCVVFAIGACACDKGIFTTGYHMVGPVDKIIKEIDPNAIIAYVPGCPPKPEAMISGIVKALSAL
jgi:Ni,Fe-hydrogenase III small subunit